MARLHRNGLLLGLVAAGVGAVVLWRALAPSHAAASSPVAVAPQAALPELVVPHATGEIVVDGEVDDPGWASPARTGGFLVNGATARPYSDARFVWRDGTLYVVLYAADEDIRALHDAHDGPVWQSDAFHLVFRTETDERALDVSPTGVVADALRKPGGPYDYAWESGVHLATDLDGTLNAPGDDDEEWLVELAIPMKSLGLTGRSGERVSLRIRRCDTPHDGKKICAGWDERSLVLE